MKDVYLADHYCIREGYDGAADQLSGQELADIDAQWQGTYYTGENLISPNDRWFHSSSVRQPRSPSVFIFHEA